MPAMTARGLLAWVFGVWCLAAACGGRTLDNQQGLNESEAEGAGGSGSGGAAASVNASAASGVGASGSATVSSGQGAAGGGVPTDCLSCVLEECPEAIACLTDPVCAGGLVCAVTQCLEGGAPDPECFIDCFGGDIDAALAAFEALTCVFTTCGEACQGELPFP
jgi:hypothetical protein